MARLAALRAKARRACDRAFAERVRILPKLIGGAVIGGADTRFPEYETEAIYRAASALQEVHGAGSRRGMKLEGIGLHAGLSFSVEAVGSQGKPLPQDGWHVQLLEQPGKPEFRLKPAALGASGRISFDIIPLGAK